MKITAPLLVIPIVGSKVGCGVGINVGFGVGLSAGGASAAGDQELSQGDKHDGEELSGAEIMWKRLVG